MTIGTTRSQEYDVESLVRQAHIDAGLLNVNQHCSAAQTRDGIDKLERMSKGSAVHGFMARETDFETITLTAAISVYDLPVGILDITGTAMYTPPGETVEIPVNFANRERWQTISAKSSTDSIPCYFFPNKATIPISVKLWPIPGAAQDTGTVRFQVLKYRADILSAGVTPDYEVYWQDYIVAELAARLALSNSLTIDRYTALQGKALSLLKEAKAMSRQRGPQQFRIGYRSNWLGR